MSSYLLASILTVLGGVALLLVGARVGTLIERKRTALLHAEQREVWHAALLKLGIDPDDPKGRKVPETAAGLTSWTGVPIDPATTKGVGERVRWDESRVRR